MWLTAITVYLVLAIMGKGILSPKFGLWMADFDQWMPLFQASLNEKVPKTLK